MKKFNLGNFDPLTVVGGLILLAGTVVKGLGDNKTESKLVDESVKKYLESKAKGES